MESCPRKKAKPSTEMTESRPKAEEVESSSVGSMGLRTESSAKVEVTDVDMCVDGNGSVNEEGNVASENSGSGSSDFELQLRQILERQLRLLRERFGTN